ncbi:MAG: iron-sulfur cluster repair di-iron protein [Planctomycetota bacterium]
MPLLPTPETPIGEIAAAIPAAVTVFERSGMDFCCGGAKSLEDAARQAGQDAEAVLEEIRGLARHPEERDWTKAGLGELLDHILSTHHLYLKEAMPRLWSLAVKVSEVHGKRHPEIRELRREMSGLFGELEPHMMKEEQILFPLIRAIADQGRDAAAVPGSPEAPMRVMEMEHENAGKVLKRMRELAGGYQPPEDACVSCRALYSGLEEMEQDLHRHIHLENNVLHPRVRDLEAKTV